MEFLYLLQGEYWLGNDTNLHKKFIDCGILIELIYNEDNFQKEK